MSHSTDIQTLFKTLGLPCPPDSAHGIEVRTPIDASVLARVAVSTDAQVGAAIARAHQRGRPRPDVHLLGRIGPIR